MPATLWSCGCRKAQLCHSQLIGLIALSEIILTDTDLQVSLTLSLAPGRKAPKQGGT